MFGTYRVLIDPWEVEYGDQTPLASLEDRPDEQVDHEVEVTDGQWSAITPAKSATVPERILFVDGVRRLEARVHARQGERLIYGAFGSYAVGAVELRNSEANLGEIRVFRSAVLGAGERLPAPVQVRTDLVYRPESTAATEVDGPLRHIQRAMRPR